MLNFKDKALSWSAISSFRYNPEEWYKKYVLGIPQKTNAEMEFGKKIGKKLELDPTYLPQVPRYGKQEYEFSVVFNGIRLVGYADSFDSKGCKSLGEYKTGVKKWDQKRADEHGQLTMYCLMNYVQNKIRPDDVEITLTWLPTKRKESGDFSVDISFVDPIEKNIKIFKTKRTMQDVFKFGAEINAVYKDMEEYVKKRQLQEVSQGV